MIVVGACSTSYQNLELMILHNLRFVTKLFPALVVVGFADGVAIVHLAGLLRFFSRAFDAYPTLGNVAVTKLVEELSFEIFFKSGVTVIAKTEKILVLVGSVEVWAAYFVRSSRSGVSTRRLPRQHAFRDQSNPP